MPVRGVRQPRLQPRAHVVLLERAGAKQRLRGGEPLPEAAGVLAAQADADAVAAAREIGFPVALKVHSPDIAHKTEVGGVRLNLQDEAMVAGAFDGILRSVRAARPDARVEGTVVQPMLRYAHAREVLVGVSTEIGRAHV